MNDNFNVDRWMLSFYLNCITLFYYLQTAFLTLIGHAEYIYSTLLFILPPLVVLVIIMGQNREMTFIYQNMIPLIRVYFFGFFYNIIL
jgi:hypothetical protein